ncbi:MAG: HlyC/CorC family transporter [Blautia sp.]|nr:HlyC/CorC family transporter [Blautia sp.]
MHSGDIIQICTLILLILLSAFFSSAETAMTTVNQIHIQALMDEGDKKARILYRIISDPGKMLSTILIGNNIVNMAASALMTTLTIRLFGNIYVGIATGILTLLILIFGEITPKTLAAIHAEKLALSYAKWIYAIMVALTPVIFLITAMANGIMMLLGIDPNKKNTSMTEHELRTLVGVGEEDGIIENEEKQMIYNVFDFGDSCAKDVMIPRIDMTFIDVDSTYENLMETFREVKHTRYPVFENNTDNVIGIINMKDILIYPKDQFFSIRDILREPYFTFEHKPTADLLIEMRKASLNLAIVLDEYGSTAGLVTLEDLLEEIVGEIRDEYDEDEKEDIIVLQPDREYQVSGSAKLSDINEMLSLKLESEEYDSISGFMLEQLDRLPTYGQVLELSNGVRLVVDELDKNRIESIHIWLPDNTASSTKTD